MKKISLFAILLAAAAMTACTDYKAQINDAYEDAAFKAAADAIMEGLSGGEPIVDLSTSRFPGTEDVPCGDIWCGPLSSYPNMNSQILWYTYFDSAGSFIVFNDGYNANMSHNDPDFRHVVNGYGNVGGYFDLTGETRSAYASVNADIGNPFEVDYRDVSSKSGICVVYSSTSQLKLMLSFYGEAEECKYDKPMVLLPASGTGEYTIEEFTWDAFKQEGWAKMPVDVHDVITKLFGFDFQFATKFSDQSGNFKIYSIGYLGTCNQLP